MSQLVSISIVTFICYEHVRVVKVRNSKWHFVTFTKRLRYPLENFIVSRPMSCTYVWRFTSTSKNNRPNDQIRMWCPFGATCTGFVAMKSLVVARFLFARHDIFKFEFFEFNTTGEEIFLCEKWLDTLQLNFINNDNCNWRSDTADNFYFSSITFLERHFFLVFI